VILKIICVAWHFLNLATHKAFEVVNLIRRRCANFHLGPGHHVMEALPKSALVSYSACRAKEPCCGRPRSCPAQIR